MAVQQHFAGALRSGGNLNEQQRRAAGQLMNLPPLPGQRQAVAPAVQQLHGGLHVAVAFPIRVKGRGFVGDGDVFLKRRQDAVPPNAVGEFKNRVRRHEPSS